MPGTEKTTEPRSSRAILSQLGGSMREKFRGIIG